MTLPGERYGQRLSPREADVLRLTAEGRDIGDIARQLYLSEGTVKTHRLHIFQKLGAGNAAHAVHLAYQRGELPVLAAGTAQPVLAGQESGAPGLTTQV